MTRINVIDPSQLTDQHLMAEYRELPMVMGSLRRSVKSKNGLPKIPSEYTLNRGHVSFFYNKGKFLHRRYKALVAELLKRGYELDPNRTADFSVFTENNLYNEWQPTQTALQINAERIGQRILQKPHWYKYQGKQITTLVEYTQLLNPNKLWK